MRARAVVGASLGALVGFSGLQPAGAAPTDIVISELMYHPADDAPVEFLELANRGGATEDLSGWCLATGIDFCFPAGTSIAPGGYVVVTDDLDGFAGIYGNAVVAVGQYAGGLSNGGETVDLLDAGGAIIDTVSYDDANPWPATPDGDGPSLELIDPDVDNDDASNWAASIDPSGHTVGAVNSVNGLVLPTIQNVTADPFRPLPNASVTVSAQLDDANTATLSYVINWDAEQTLAMNDGPSSVGGADDGVWSATIPGQSAGDLIRYRVDVAGNGGSTGAPIPGDSIDYLGVVVVDPVATNLPVLEWFMEDSVHDDLIANHRFDDVTGDAVVSYDGVVYDNVEMYIRGNSSRSATKMSWKVEFPKGYLFDMGGLLDRPVDEFNMQRSSFVHEELGWGTAEAAGMVALQYFKIRTHRNGEFYSVATYGGTYDGRWRDDNDRSDWSLYKAEKERGRALPTEAELIASGDWDKKEGDDDDWSDLHEFTTVMNGPSNASQRAWMLENLNIPEFVNYAAVVSVLRHSDTNWYNYYVTRDTEGTGRWEMVLWDMDTMFRVEADDDDGEFVTPADNGNLLMRAVMEQPEFRQMYFRRVRSLIDEFLQPNDYEDWANGLFDTYRAEFELDRGVWGGRTAARQIQVLFDGIQARRDDVAANTGPEGTRNFPPAASGQTPIEIRSIEYAPAGDDANEYVELTNTSASESIDVTGWQITGPTTGTIASGAVLLPGARAYIVANDNAFRSANGASNLVIGTLDGALPDAGATLTLTTADAAVVDTATYPVSGVETDVNYVGLGQSWQYFDQGPAPSGWRTLGFDDNAWATGSGEFGFGDGDEATVISSAQRTSYFRTSFNVDDAADVVELGTSLRADDGAVVYVNGIEVVRDNMPAGTIGHNTNAASTRYVGENDLRSFVLPTGTLQSGRNVIAVEIHNRSLSSSDLSFDLSLDARVLGGGGGGGTPPGQVIGLGSSWRYFDQGAAANGWRDLGFNDNAWATGNGEFGFGDGDETTVISSTERTSYYRTTFDITDPAVVSEVSIVLRADDGAVVYLNGVEVVRDNMPAGVIGHGTNAASTRYTTENDLRSFLATSGALRTGTNVIAVEIHNRSLSSSDVSFDLSLRAD